MRRIIITIAVALLVTGCVTPMIPLPPPDSRLMSLTIPDKSKGVVTFGYQKDSRFNAAYFYIFNESTGKGVIQQANADGSLTSDPFVVKEGHFLSIWVKRATGEERSDIVNLVVDYSDNRNIRDLKD